MAVETAIDTNRYRDFVDGEPRTVAVFRSAPKIFVPFAVVAELRAGFAVGTRGAENQRIFEHFLHRERVQVLMPTMETTRHYANLYRQLKAAGTPIPTNDLWIAAIVVEHDLTLFSRDSHFEALPQIPRI
ncbi:MAG: type II toxin-antitoxin system VapC family toxin [Spirochaetales bacterium]|nr:type II toxin-antitoxin system VapC family toxin [Spirochaetales bacterium]